MVPDNRVHAVAEVTSARSSDVDRRRERNGKRLPFRLIGIVSDLDQAGRVVAIAGALPRVGFALMLRDPGHDEARVRMLGRRVSLLERPANVFLLANGVVIPGMAGVHWPSGRLQQSSRIRGSASVADWYDGPIVGGSVHNERELSIAESAHLDYAVISPIFSPRSKTVAATLGTDALHRLCTSTPLPLFALGGIDSENVRSCIDAGAYGIAAVSWFQQHPHDRLIETISDLFTQ